MSATSNIHPVWNQYSIWLRWKGYLSEGAMNAFHLKRYLRIILAIKRFELHTKVNSLCANTGNNSSGWRKSMSFERPFKLDTFKGWQHRNQINGTVPSHSQLFRVLRENSILNKHIDCEKKVTCLWIRSFFVWYRDRMPDTTCDEERNSITPSFCTSLPSQLHPQLCTTYLCGGSVEVSIKWRFVTIIVETCWTIPYLLQ